MHRFRSAAPAAAALLCLSGPTLARPLTVDDLLHQESFGAAAVDPGGRWLVFERRDPFDTAPRFDAYVHMAAVLSRLQVVDLARPGPARPLLAPDPGPGVTLGDFSPTGRRLAVYRMRDRHWSLGVVTLATRKVRWFRVNPELDHSGQTLAWLNDDELLVVDEGSDAPSWPLRQGWAQAKTLPALWAAQARGEVSAIAIGSGAYRDIRRRPPPRRLLRLDVRRGALRVLARGELIDLAVAPGGEQVALFSAGEDVQPRPNGPSQGTQGVSTQAVRLSVLDLASGVRRDICPSCDMLEYLLAWSPSGGSLLVYARQRDADWTTGTLLRVEAHSGRTEPLGAGLEPLITWRPEVVRAGWMGETPIVLARPAGGAGRPDWYGLAGGRIIALTHALPAAPLALQSVDGAGLTAISAGAAWHVDPTGVAQAVAAAPVVALLQPTPGAQYGGRIQNGLPMASWVLAHDGPQSWLDRLDGGGLHPVIPFSETEGRLLAASASHPSALALDARTNGVGILRLATPGRTLTIARVNPALAAIDVPEVRPVHHPGPDGQSVTSWLFLPAKALGAPPPLVVMPYSGANYPAAPFARLGEREFVTDVRPLVGHGYAVLVPSLPLPRDHHDPISGLASRILSVVDTAAADPSLAGRFDPHRLALWGHSYGGYTVMATLGQTDRFAAAISIAGISNLLSKWETLPEVHRTAPEEGLWSNWSTGATESGQDGMEAPPWDDPERYLRNSPIMAANEITTPLMLFHSDLDVIPLPQSEAMFSALYRQDKDAVLVTYFGEGHAPMSSGNLRDLFGRAFTFLDAHLR